VAPGEAENLAGSETIRSRGIRNTFDKEVNLSLTAFPNFPGSYQRVGYSEADYTCYTRTTSSLAMCPERLDGSDTRVR
jgi:hypothetical protein